ncbi:MAG: hypothetical protein FWG75_08060 [Cystobacterineae bacterium]|nr:hypothetical protein [Cystobacterineae bacterium]
MEKPLRMVVLSVSAGAGHLRAAQALCAAAAQMPGIEAVHVDVMDLVSKGFRNFYSRGYMGLVEKAPEVWSYLYQHTDAAPKSLFNRFRRQLERLNTQKLKKEMAHLAPDVIVCTHFLPAELLSRRLRKGKPTPPVWVHVTDFDVHGFWLHPHMQGYFVASEEVAARLEGRGMGREHIHVTGIAIMPQFSQALSREAAALELGLSPDKRTLLMMSGGFGVGGIESLVEHVAKTMEEVQILALAGRNEALLGKLQEIATRHPGRVFPQGFTRSIERMMAAADVAVTKPGGLTTSECLAMQLPMLVVSPIPGQEERNADFLLETGCASKAVDAASLLFKLKALFQTPERLAHMRRQQKAVAKPHAAKDIVETIVKATLKPL